MLIKPILSMFTHYKVVLEGFKMTVFFYYQTPKRTNTHSYMHPTKKWFNNDVLCLTFFVCLKQNLCGQNLNELYDCLKKVFKIFNLFWKQKTNL